MANLGKHASRSPEQALAYKALPLNAFPGSSLLRIRARQRSRDLDDSCTHLTRQLQDAVSTPRFVSSCCPRCRRRRGPTDPERLGAVWWHRMDRGNGVHHRQLLLPPERLVLPVHPRERAFNDLSCTVDHKYPAAALDTQHVPHVHHSSHQHDTNAGRRKHRLPGHSQRARKPRVQRPKRSFHLPRG